jgi:serine/threonine-protein kinase
MAPEQFQGKAVFASDIYSLGVTMYQTLTGSLPYNTPTPADLERLMRGELTTPPRARNAKIPKGISDIVVKAMAVDIPNRFQRASEVLEAILAARARPVMPAGGRRTERGSARLAPLEADGSQPVDDIQARLKAREGPQAKFCWHCRKALHARTDHCPFCGEAQ